MHLVRVASVRWAEPVRARATTRRTHSSSGCWTSCSTERSTSDMTMCDTDSLLLSSESSIGKSTRSFSKDDRRCCIM